MLLLCYAAPLSIQSLKSNYVCLQVGQLFDENVAWTALELLDEACDDKMNLEAVVCAMGEKYLLTCSQFIHAAPFKTLSM